MHSLCGLIKTSVCAAALAALALPAHSDPAPGQGTWETTLQARDGNHDGVVEAYYDTALNITWSRDWGKAPADQGCPTWCSSNSYVQNFLAQRNAFHGTNWRLPSTVNLPSSLGDKASPDSSELAHLFYVTLGNKGSPDAGHGLGNTANFVNMQPDTYWSGTNYFSGGPWHGPSP